MNKNYTNIGVQLVPVFMVIAAVCFYMLGSLSLCITCGFLAVAMWAALFGVDTEK